MLIMQTVSVGKDRFSPSSIREQLYYEVPNRRIHSFVGREDIISRIDQAFSAGQGPRIAVLQGMGGQGKSQVALEYCHRKKNSPYSAIFWVDATNEDTTIGSFQSISERIKSPTDHLPDSDARVAFVLRALTSRFTSWLLVFDNCDDPTAFPNIQDFFPKNDLGAILITGRHADAGALVIGRGIGFIELPGLDKEAALALLIEQSEIKDPSSQDAEAIVERLGYHPLALTQAGAYIRKRKTTLSRFLNDYKCRRELILKNTPQLSQYRKKLGDAEKETSLNVFTTWELSFQQLQSHSTEESLEIRILTLFAFFDPKDISERFLADYVGNYLVNSGDEGSSTESVEVLDWRKDFTDDQCQWNSDIFKDVLINLKEFSLLQSFSHGSDGFYHSTLHPLVKDWIQIRTEKSVYQENTLAAAVLLGQMIAFSYRHDEFCLPLSLKQTILVHIITQEDNYETHARLQSTMPLSQEQLNNYLIARNWFAELLLSMGSYKSAEMIYERGKADSEILLGPEHYDTLRIVSGLATTYRYQGRLADAKKLEMQVLETRKRLLGVEHSHTLISMNNLAAIYSQLRRWAEAIELNLQVLETRKRLLGIEHPDTLIGMNNLATIYHEQGRKAEAKELQMQVFEMRKRVLGVEHPSTLISMDNLALTYTYQQRYAKALELNLQVLETRKRVLGVEHPDTLISMNNLATIYYEQGRWAEAKELLMQVIERRKRVLGVEHPNTLMSMTNLAHTYKSQGWNDEAIRLMKDVVERRTRVLGADHPFTRRSAKDLSDWTQASDSSECPS